MSVVQIFNRKAVPGRVLGHPTCFCSQTGRVQGTDLGLSRIRVEAFYTSLPPSAGDDAKPEGGQSQREWDDCWLRVLALAPQSMEWREIERFGREAMPVWQEIASGIGPRCQDAEIYAEIGRRIEGALRRDKVREAFGADFGMAWEYAIKMFA